MNKLKKQFLLEADVQETEYHEPTSDELLALAQSEQLSPEDLDKMYNDGEISEETYNETLGKINSELEATADNSQPTEEVPPEELDQSYQNGEITEDEYNNMDNQLPENEADFAANNDDGMEQMEPQAIESPFNLVHLYDQFIALKKYINIYIDSFNDIDLDQITDLQYKTVSNVFLDIKDILTNLNFYLDNEFELEDYKKNLYIYLLYNKRFSENIIKLRRVLQLHKEVLTLDDDEDSRNNKKKK